MPLVTVADGTEGSLIFARSLGRTRVRCPVDENAADLCERRGRQNASRKSGTEETVGRQGDDLSLVSLAGLLVATRRMPSIWR